MKITGVIQTQWQVQRLNQGSLSVYDYLKWKNYDNHLELKPSEFDFALLALALVLFLRVVGQFLHVRLYLNPWKQNSLVLDKTPAQPNQHNYGSILHTTDTYLVFVRATE